MRFRAKYICITTERLPDYWRSVDADNVNEAMTIARRYVRKGYMLAGVMQSNTATA